MNIDERQLRELIVESEDLQVDALRDTKSRLADTRDLRADRRRAGTDPDDVVRYNAARRSVLQKLGLVGGGLATRGLWAGGIGTALVGILGRPASAQEDVDVQILQTASSLELLAVATYGAALTLPFIKDGNPVVKTFAETTMRQHDEHNQAFQAQTEELGGEPQTKPNMKYAPIVEQAKPNLKSPADVVDLAATLEEVAGDTYLGNLATFNDPASRLLMATVMGVEVQHLATLRAVKALLAGGGEALIKIPTDVAALPAAAGSVAFPDALPEPDKASPPQEGAVK